ncbi:hypothetical protein BDW72DRAFT_167903 [Aspergillus terricola var. indicus]
MTHRRLGGIASRLNLRLLLLSTALGTKVCFAFFSTGHCQACRKDFTNPIGLSSGPLWRRADILQLQEGERESLHDSGFY